MGGSSENIQVLHVDDEPEFSELPGRNGIEFLEAFREDNQDLPFILYTGKRSEEVASEAISAGVTEYLQKEAGTSQYEVLAKRIENAVERQQEQCMKDDDGGVSPSYCVLRTRSVLMCERERSSR